MSLFSASIQHRSYYLQINTLCFVLGLLIAAAWQTSTAVSRAGLGVNRAGFYYGSGQAAVQSPDFRDEKEKLAEREAEIKALREQATAYQNKLAQGNDATETINRQLQETKLQAGLTNVQGPGVEIVLSDSRNKPTNTNDIINQANLIHDVDVLTVVNELRAAGAEAISVNDQRVVGTTPIRCVGPTVQVNGVPFASPFVIRAIGDDSALLGGLKTPGGVFEKIGLFDPAMIKAEKKAALKLPAFAGNTQIRFAKSEAIPKADQKTDPKPDAMSNSKTDDKKDGQ